MLSVRILPFTKRAKRRLISHPKFYYFDVGVYRTLRPKGPLDSVEEIDGPCLETLFLQHLRAINDYYRLGYNIYFWRTANQVEVDFIIYGERGLHAFEIKRTNRINNKNLTSLRAFKDDYQEAKLYLVYDGEQTRYINDVQVIPIVNMLTNMHDIIS